MQTKKKKKIIANFAYSLDMKCCNINVVITKTCLFKYTENFTTKKMNENFQTKYSDIFHISAQNIDCGYSLEAHRRGGSNEYPQSMFLSRNMKNNVHPCKPQFYYIKVGFKGSKLYRHVFVMFIPVLCQVLLFVLLYIRCLISSSSFSCLLQEFCTCIKKINKYPILSRSGRLLVSSVPMLEQSIAKYILNSVLVILKIDTIFTVFSLKEK